MVKDNRRPWILLIPVILIMGIFVFYPIIQTFYYSMHNYKLTRPDQIEYIGFQNYWDIIQANDFQRAFFNSSIVLIYVILIATTVSIVFGLLLNIRTKITPALTAIAIVPWALPPLVNGIIWSFIFHPSYGMINKILLSLNLIENPIAFTNNRWLVLFIVSIIVSWRVIPFCSIIILSSLQSISKEVYEASSMDGASKIQTFFSVTLPLLLPALAIVLTQVSMAGLSVFDEIIALVNYRQDVQTLLIYNYQNTFSFLDFGYGSAITYIIMLVTGLAGYFYIRNMAKEM